MPLKSYKIKKVKKRSADYALIYGISSSCLIEAEELKGFIPQPGQTILLDLDDDNTVIGIRINGQRFR